MTSTPITSEVTRCERNAFGQFEAIGGNGWLLEPGLVAADIAATGADRGPYYVVSPTGDRSFLTVLESSNGTPFTFSTDRGDQPLTELPAPQ